MRYLLGGYYGMRNVGDDLLLYLTLAEVSRIDRDARFTVISSVPIAAPPGARVRAVPGGRRLETLRQLLGHDVWLFGGGGLLQDGSPRSLDALRRLGRAVCVAQLLRRRIALVGVGVGPLSTPEGRAAARRVLRMADFVTVRDVESQRVLSNLSPATPAHVTVDPVFALSPPARAGTPLRGGRRTLGISLLAYWGSLGRADRSDTPAALHVAEALNVVLARHPAWSVKLFEFFAGSDAYGDATVLARLHRHLAYPDRVSYRRYDGDFFSLYAELGACAAVVGMRFHACVLAYLAERPCLMLAYHPKCLELATRLRLPAHAVASLDLLEDPQALAARLEALVANPSRFHPQVSPAALRADAERNFSVLAEWLRGLGVSDPDRGRAVEPDAPRLRLLAKGRR